MILIILVIIAVLGTAGFLGLRAYIADKLGQINSSNLAVSAHQKAPDFTLPLTDGSEAKLSELLQDKEVVVLNIFASWCGPCKEEFPGMENVYEKYKDKMEIIAVTGYEDDTMDDMIQYKEDHGLSFMVGMKNESIDSLKVGGFPTTYIIDRNGDIVFSMSGAFQNEEEFEKIVTSLMGDDYEGKQIARYIFAVVDKDKGSVPGAQIRLYSDTADETLTTDDNGSATYYTENAQELKVEILNLPEGYTSNADEITVGLESGFKLITIGKE